MSPWAWVGLGAVVLVGLGILTFILAAVFSGVRDAQRAEVAGKACPRCGHPWGEPWPAEPVEPGPPPPAAHT